MKAVDRLRRHVLATTVGIALAALALALAPLVARGQDPRATLARRAALDWLAMTDRLDATGSWKAASPAFQKSVDEARWSQALAAVRAPLGATLRRAVTTSTAMSELPGVPGTGDFVVLVFRTSFEKRDDALERLTLGRGPDGTYRVIGYVVK